MMEKIDYFDLEPTKIILPKDFFWCVFTWELYHLTKYYEPWLILLVSILVPVVAVKKMTYLSYSVLYGIISLSLFLVLSIKFWLSYKRYDVASMEKVNLAQAVLTMHPGVEEEKWDKVAYKMNAIFFQHCSWATPDFFFSGQQCQSYFREHVLKPFLQGKICPGETESDTLIDAVVSYLAGVHAIFEEFLKTGPVTPSLKFQILPKNKYGGHFTFLRRRYNSSGTYEKLKICRHFARSVSHQENPGIILSLISAMFNLYNLLIVSDYNTKYYKLDVIDRLKFLSFVIATAPGVDMERWDQVAMKMNQYLHTRNSKTGGRRESFFDGKQYLDFFIKEFKPLVADKNTFSFSEKLFQPLLAGQMLPYHDLDCIAADAFRVCQLTSEKGSGSFLSFTTIIDLVMLYFNFVG
ncbi:hypothetical protein ZYGR_0AI00110 [Zygosaccharomyces rouxii]|uniref:Uncharacterized protein n=1 Tax=Zygosaccharomyces rouxii TaxID=4956 RepID=A0A1Q3AAG5_ZYGRO|nr:hypothetical protein ZYGR_0AI00110 [Zygosaccharomyces rouxii]